MPRTARPRPVPADDYPPPFYTLTWADFENALGRFPGGWSLTEDEQAQVVALVRSEVNAAASAPLGWNAEFAAIVQAALNRVLPRA